MTPVPRPAQYLSLAPITTALDLGMAAISIMTAMMGTEMTPLITALQYRALIGSIGVKQSTTPMTRSRRR